MSLYFADLHLLTVKISQNIDLTKKPLIIVNLKISNSQKLDESNV